MTIDSTIERLLWMQADDRASIIKTAWNNYTRFLSEVARDIYHSCIQDFYAQYDPIRYKRHGYPEGKNLYQAEDIEWTESTLAIRTAANKLWKYHGKRDKRGKVLTSVIRGYRGSSSKISGSDWPQPWYTSYPNDYSMYFEWDGIDGPVTMKDVMDYFTEHVLEETEDVFWEYVSELI